MSSRINYFDWGTSPDKWKENLPYPELEGLLQDASDEEKYLARYERAYKRSDAQARSRWPDAFAEGAPQNTLQRYSFLPGMSDLMEDGKFSFGKWGKAALNNAAYEIDQGIGTWRFWDTDHSKGILQGLGMKNADEFLKSGTTASRVANTALHLPGKALQTWQALGPVLDAGANIAAGMDPVDATVDAGVAAAGWYGGSTLGAAAGTALAPFTGGLSIPVLTFLGGMGGSWAATTGKNAIFGDPMEKVQMKQMREEQVRQMDEERKRRMQEMYGGSRRDLYSGYGDSYGFGY